MTARYLSLTTLAFVMLLSGCHGFSSLSLSSSRVRGFFGRSNNENHQPSLTALHAKKKRRRKNIDSPSPSSSGDDLPDFDLNEDEGASKPKAAAAASMSDPSSAEISSAMMGSSSKPVRSVDQLIADRSLEKTFEFDEPEDDSLPDLAVLAAQQQQGGKKKAKREARVAAAMERQSSEEDEFENPLKNIPFLLDEKGEVSAIKFLEAGAWLGIFLLVAWEVYINSPFFERAQPMAPFIYDFYL